MQRIVTIDNKEVSLETSGYIPLLYKKEFKRDFFEDVAKINVREIDIEILLCMLWTLAKTSDDKLPNIEEWLKSFKVLPILDYYTDIEELVVACLTGKQANSDDGLKKTEAD